MSLCVAAAGCNSRSNARGLALDPRPAVEYLAADELEGRGPGTRGLDRAADYLAQQFDQIGLRELPGQPDFFQPFVITTATEIGPATALRVGDRAFTPKSDFIPIGITGEAAFSGPVVFAGYGMKSAEHQYDDYAGLDVKDKVVLAMRYEPHDEKGKSRFAPDGWSDAASFIEKARHARDAGAAAMLIVTPPDFAKDDALLPFSLRRLGEGRALPLIHIKQTVADELLRRGGSADLKSLQQKIDATVKPSSFPLAGVEVSGETDIERKLATVKNVMAYVPGKRADEYVVVGAHYDHLGRGGIGSLSRGADRIHNGADDNASGTAALLSLAAEFKRAGRPERSILFVAFTGEEQGLLGSNHFVNHSPVPLGNIVAMVNLDMVGRLRTATEVAAGSTTRQTTTREATTQDSKYGVLSIGGAGTAAHFDAIVNAADARSALDVRDIGRGGLGPSDHMAFAQKRIPVLFFFTGLHGDYHRPSDDAEKVNYDGLREIIAFGRDVIAQIAAAPRGAYVETADTSRMRVGVPSPHGEGSLPAGGSGGGGGAMLGVVPDYSSALEATGGVLISGAKPGSPAAAAGLAAGDIVVRFGNRPIQTLQDLSDALATHKPGDTVKLKVLRGEPRTEVETQATLASPLRKRTNEKRHCHCRSRFTAGREQPHA